MHRTYPTYTGWRVYLAQSIKGDMPRPTWMDTRKWDEAGYKAKSKTNHKTHVQLYPFAQASRFCSGLTLLVRKATTH